MKDLAHTSWSSMLLGVAATCDEGDEVPSCFRL